MPRSSVDRLPAALRDQVHQLLKDGHSVSAITEHLHTLGAEVSRSAVGRYTQRFQAMAAKMREAKEIAGAFGAQLEVLNEDRTGRLLVEMLNGLVFRTLLQAGEGDADTPFSADELMKLARALKDTQGAANLDVARELKLREKVLAQAADAAVSVAKSKGLSEDTITAIKARILEVS